MWSCPYLNVYTAHFAVVNPGNRRILTKNLHLHIYVKEIMDTLFMMKMEGEAAETTVQFGETKATTETRKKIFRECVHMFKTFMWATKLACMGSQLDGVTTRQGHTCLM
mmetsp:Transcript_9180/g.12745  ORF Transcript_9180/g.12745 Transcript_9180/m.12745 type:complete len:109 (+) Transcript_9180:122-448(+)